MTPGNYAQYQFWFNVFQFLFTCVVLVVSWWRTREKVGEKKLKSLEERISAVETSRSSFEAKIQEVKTSLAIEIQDVKAAVKSMPVCGNHQRMEENDRFTADALEEINKGLSELKGLVNGRMEGIGSALDLIQQHLLNGGK